LLVLNGCATVSALPTQPIYPPTIDSAESGVDYPHELILGIVLNNPGFYELTIGCGDMDPRTGNYREGVYLRFLHAQEVVRLTGEGFLPYVDYVHIPDVDSCVIDSWRLWTDTHLAGAGHVCQD